MRRPGAAGADALRLMARADQSLGAARILLDSGLPLDSVNRSYYAMFYAASALLVTHGLSSSKHSGVLALLDREFVRTGAIPRELSAWIRAAFRDRQIADYGAEAARVEGTAAETLRNAEEFVARTRPVLDGLLDQLDRASPDGS